MQSYILLNLSLVTNHKKDFLTFLAAQINRGFVVDWEASTYTSGKISLVKAKELTGVTKLTAPTINKYLKTYPDTYEYCGRFAVLPVSIYNKLLTETEELAAAEKNGIVRTFCYFVCMCWLYRDFSRTKSNIATDLDNRLPDVIARINWLIDKKYINYKHKHAHYAGQQAKPAVYQLYDDEVPSNYANSWWWENQLAHRQISIEELLSEYKNIF